METSSFKKSTEEWLVELNDPQTEHRRDVLTALVDSGTLDDRLIHQLKLIARGDPDLRAQFLAKRVLNSRGIKISPKPGGLSWSSEFWISFFLFPILNFVLFYGLRFFALTAGKPTGTFQLVVNILLLIYFGLRRKSSVGLGILASLGCSIVMVPIGFFMYLSWTCWPDGCPVPP
jgi:hypothetical protein